MLITFSGIDCLGIPYTASLGIRSTNKTAERLDCEVDEMSENLPEKVQRWTAKRRVALVISILKGETSVKEAARKHGLTVREVEEWRDRFLMGAENALRSRPRDEVAMRDQEIKKLKEKIGDLVMDIDILKAAQRIRPFLDGASDE